MVARKLPDWLPAGWAVNVEVKNGRKAECYFNTETGQKFYSKNDVIRYIEKGHVRTSQLISQHNKKCPGKKSIPHVMKTTDFPDWLPHDWILEVKTQKGGRKYKCYIDPVNKFKFYSKPEVSRYLETVKCTSGTSKQKKIDTESVNNLYIDEPTKVKSSLKLEVSQIVKVVRGKNATSRRKVLVERATPDGLPVGWIKEIIIQKKANGMRRDPYYTDPASGYIFRSRKDALRYLETGDINRCAIKPKKRGIDDMELINDRVLLQSAGSGQSQTTRRRLFGGKESCDASSLVAPNAGDSNKRQGDAVTADATPTSASEIVEEKQIYNNGFEKHAETKDSSGQNSSAFSKAEGSKRKCGGKAFDENRHFSTPATDILQEEKLQENELKKLGNRKNKIDSRNCWKRIALNLPRRSSKRLAGLEPELVSLGSTEQTLRAVAREFRGRKANLSGFAPDVMADGTTQQLEAEPKREIASICTEALSNVETSNKCNKHHDKDRAIPEQQPRMLEIEKKDDKNTDSELFFGKQWSDPCLEFAVKTLTGAIPIEDDLTIQGFFQQQVDASQNQGDNCLVVPGFSLPNSLKNDGAPEAPVHLQQLPENPTLLPPVHASLPSCSVIGPQQSSLEGSKEYQAKVK